MKKLDQKQIPQFVALCILSFGVFGYFVVKMVAPGTASASTEATPPSSSAVSVTASGSAPGTVKGVTTPGDDTLPTVIPPSAGMRDPFAVGYIDPKTIVLSPPTAASQSASKGTATASAMPSLMPMPSLQGPETVSALSGLTIRPNSEAATSIGVTPLALAPTWTVTGVLLTDSAKMAILRNGQARRIVRSGELVDSTYRLAEVTRNWVVLRHGSLSYRILLGVGKPSPTQAAPPAVLPAPPTSTAPPTISVPIAQSVQPRTAQNQVDLGFRFLDDQAPQ